MSTVADDIAELAAPHKGWLMRVITRRTGDAVAADDVFADVMLAVAKSDDRPSTDDQIQPWLCKIAIRQAALFHRKRSRRNKMLDGFAAGQPSASDESSDPIFWLLDQERRDVVQQCLAELTAEARELLMMKLVERKTYRELADQLDVAPHVVEYRVARAKEELRTLLMQRGLNKEDLS